MQRAKPTKNVFVLDTLFPDSTILGLYFDKNQKSNIEIAELNDPQTGLQLLWRLWLFDYF